MWMRVWNFGEIILFAYLVTTADNHESFALYNSGMCKCEKFKSSYEIVDEELNQSIWIRDESSIDMDLNVLLHCVIFISIAEANIQ